jgi:hypothetical protein
MAPYRDAVKDSAGGTEAGTSENSIEHVAVFIISYLEEAVTISSDQQ